jgi:hypothetical protein
MLTKALILAYFASHSTVEQFHFTADGQAFFHEEHASNHAATLEDKTVTSLTREDAQALPEDGEEQEAETAPKKDYSKMKKAELQAELTTREITFEQAATVAALISLLIADDEKKNGSAE